jgi:hypothetical protein
VPRLVSIAASGCNGARASLERMSAIASSEPSTSDAACRLARAGASPCQAAAVLPAGAPGSVSVSPVRALLAAPRALAGAQVHALALVVDFRQSSRSESERERAWSVAATAEPNKQVG